MAKKISEAVNLRTDNTMTKKIIRSRKSKDRQHNGQKKKDNMTNTDLQNTTQNIEQ